ncbi:Protein ECERIFERUM 26-like [Striga hermonthica]|uniref:Protein ECERIFERUM 26-like n=1 Tax=Striga hermonthica TaxID=68872 RepID=A0A9N7R993_STRHE|nr:Protein ECERIFERUM 26-like [Striga hermonthica]
MEEKGLIYDVKLSSIGPGNVTGPDSIFEPGSMGLAMKLHYLRGVYYLERPAFEGLSTLEIKEPMFTWLNQYPPTCGRFRRAESGRPYVKCNDCGVRFVEAKCGQTMAEWLEAQDLTAREALLLTNHSIGPDLAFSPLIYIQALDDLFRQNARNSFRMGPERAATRNLPLVPTRAGVLAANVRTQAVIAMASTGSGQDLNVCTCEIVTVNGTLGCWNSTMAMVLRVRPDHIGARRRGWDFADGSAVTTKAATWDDVRWDVATVVRGGALVLATRVRD